MYFVGYQNLFHKTFKILVMIVPELTGYQNNGLYFSHVSQIPNGVTFYPRREAILL
jgi:hypothetical protein